MSESLSALIESAPKLPELIANADHLTVRDIKLSGSHRESYSMPPTVSIDGYLMIAANDPRTGAIRPGRYRMVLALVRLDDNDNEET